ncbi:hypothetical protein MHJ_0697 [Mesomycoplasma hyopneumoniae J]|uniref:Uncharacterized protein n=2 Tax=Mesomycoplasma hyopneumoniae TaxID=2099 RepID=A4Q7Y4_MESH7|nr:hypothetical protein MHJ_0697 [Mesomycoplasma hyopneumoniae J]ABP01132.1 hypothetical protein MHP7448_0717 [Mesomycoplasma hyopneumoniae 7448]ABP01134.1 hypothetical protein MHP7448_0719 [Mesomycoplasma hyopneumoniae 7448]
MPLSIHLRRLSTTFGTVFTAATVAVVAATAAMAAATAFVINGIKGRRKKKVFSTRVWFWSSLKSKTWPSNFSFGIPFSK